MNMKAVGSKIWTDISMFKKGRRDNYKDIQQKTHKPFSRGLALFKYPADIKGHFNISST